MLRWVKRVSLYACLLLVAIFAAVNGQAVKVDLLAAEWELSLGILLVLVLVVGMALGMLIGSLLRARRAMRHAAAGSELT
ncbi:MAG: lipopolysaccharide assembly protein LapA domain-containing protein [Lysobacterales bacterium]